LLSLFLFMSEIVYRDDDARLIHASLSGDNDAFGELVTKYESLIYNTAYQITGNAEDAFDISQETFIKAYRSLGSFRGDSKFSTWIYRICQNTAKDFLRSRARHKTVSLTAYEDDETKEIQIDIPDDNTMSQPDTSLERSENREAVRTAIANLSEDHKNVIVLRDIEGYSYDEISEILDLEIGTVKSRINRARLAIKDFLVKRNFL
jgi:RNA polymerase sigma factor (sigma-70 family)